MRLQPPWVYSISSKSKDVFFKLSQDKMFILPLLDFPMSSNISTQYKKSIEGNFPNSGPGEFSRRQTLCDIKCGISGRSRRITFTVYQCVWFSILCQTDVSQQCTNKAVLTQHRHWSTLCFCFFCHWCIGSIIIFAVVVVKLYYYPACIICV